MEEDDVWSGEYLRKEGRPAEARQVSSHSDPGSNSRGLGQKVGPLFQPTVQFVDVIFSI